MYQSIHGNDRKDTGWEPLEKIHLDKWNGTEVVPICPRRTWGHWKLSLAVAQQRPTTACRTCWRGSFASSPYSLELDACTSLRCRACTRYSKVCQKSWSLRYCGECFWTPGSASAAWVRDCRSHSCIRSAMTFAVAPSVSWSIALWRGCWIDRRRPSCRSRALGERGGYGGSSTEQRNDDVNAYGFRATRARSVGRREAHEPDSHTRGGGIHAGTAHQTAWGWHERSHEIQEASDCRNRNWRQWCLPWLHELWRMR